MANKINISIPQPCHENWEAMTAVDKGKFCASCQKKVHDFTKASDSEIVNAFQQNQNLCGRFLNTQLDRDLVKPNEKSSLWLASTAAVVSLIAIGANEVSAQEPVKTEQTDRIVLGKVAPPKSQEMEISGIITDTANVPIPGVNIMIKGTTVSAQTDFEGKYSIKAAKGTTLEFSFIGFERLSCIVGEDRKDYNFKLKEDKVSVTMGIVISPTKKRTFFGRLFHKSRYRYD